MCCSIKSTNQKFKSTAQVPCFPKWHLLCPLCDDAVKLFMWSFVDGAICDSGAFFTLQLQQKIKLKHKTQIKGDVEMTGAELEPEKIIRENGNNCRESQAAEHTEKSNSE